MKPGRRPAFKPKLREQIEINEKWNRFYALMGGVEPVKLGEPLPPKRAYTKRTADEDLEGSVLKEVGEVLAAHPNVIMCVRQNTGAAQMTGKDGKVYPVWFYRWIRNRAEMTITDYWGFVRVGPTFMPFAIECKRRNWKPNYNDDRENQQRSFIEFMQRVGGRGAFVTCVEQAQEILA